MTQSTTFGDPSALVAQLEGLIRTDGLQDLLAGFNDAGAEAEVESWVGSIENRPTGPGEVERALGRTRTETMAAALGVTADQVAQGLARLIPVTVDRITPGGRMPTGAQLDALDLSATLSDLDLGALLS